MIGRCPHVCCFDRSNRQHTHACPPEDCELCATMPARRVSWRRVLVRWAKRLVGAAAVAIVLAWLAASMFTTPGWAAGA